MRAFVFPGQGSQYIGMGVALAQNFRCAQYIFDEIDEALSFKLFKLMSQGSASDLQLTLNTQPALFAVSAAILEVLKKEFNFVLQDSIHYLAGHSLGEYSAYYAGGSINLRDTAVTLRMRGQLMQDAVPEGVGGMIALIGATMDQAEKLVEQVSNDSCCCNIANDNAPGQIIVSGHLNALETLKLHAAEMGIKRVVALPVSAPFHSPLMQSAAERMNDFLQSFTFIQPILPLINNVTAQVSTSPDQIKPLLVQQITGRVRWCDTIEHMGNSGVSEIIEVGAGKVLSGLIKRINPDIVCHNIESPDSIETWIKSIN